MELFDIVHFHLEDRGHKRSASVNPWAGVIREQRPVPVIQSHVTLLHAVDRADEGRDDYEDPDHGEDPQEDDDGDREAEAGA